MHTYILAHSNYSKLSSASSWQQTIRHALHLLACNPLLNLSFWHLKDEGEPGGLVSGCGLPAVSGLGTSGSESAVDCEP